MIEVLYDGATGAISAYGQGLTPGAGEFVGVVPDDDTFQQPGTKTLEGGVVAVTPPPAPTADELAAQQADAQQADADRNTLRQGAAALQADVASLTDSTVTLTTAQLRAMLARTDRALLALGRLLRRQGLI